MVGRIVKEATTVRANNSELLHLSPLIGLETTYCSGLHTYIMYVVPFPPRRHEGSVRGKSWPAAVGSVGGKAARLLPRNGLKLRPQPVTYSLPLFYSHYWVQETWHISPCPVFMLLAWSGSA